MDSFNGFENLVLWGAYWKQVNAAVQGENLLQ
jgi:hypothetical protein